MKATEFANFFDFTIQRNDNPYGAKYMVVDDQGVFQTRYIDNVSELGECFDSMLQDYVETTLEEQGFIFEFKNGETYYTQAKAWIETREGSGLLNTDTYEVISCLVDPSLIEDDVDEVIEQSEDRVNEVREITTIEELIEVIGEERFNALFSDIPEEIKYYKQGYDDEISAETIKDIYEKYSEVNDERTFYQYFSDEFFEENINWFAEYEWEEINYLYTERVLPELAKIEESENISLDYDGNLPDEIRDYIRENSTYLSLDSVISETAPKDMKLDLVLSTEEEANHDLGSIANMNDTAFGQTVRGYEITGFADTNKEDAMETCDNMLTNIIYQQGYTLNDIYYNLDKHSPFIDSTRQEITNSQRNMDAVTVLVKADFDTFCKIADGENIKIDKNAMIGIFDPFSGGGSLLDMELEKPISISNNQINSILFEDAGKNSWGRYTVDEVYGLVGSCWKDCIIETGKGVSAYEISNEKLEKDIAELSKHEIEEDYFDELDHNSYANANNIIEISLPNDLCRYNEFSGLKPFYTMDMPKGTILNGKDISDASITTNQMVEDKNNPGNMLGSFSAGEENLIKISYNDGSFEKVNGTELKIAIEKQAEVNKEQQQEKDKQKEVVKDNQIGKHKNQDEGLE